MATTINDENDKSSRLGLTAMHFRDKEKRMVREAFVANPELINDVTAWIFDKDPESENPLQSVRDELAE